MTDKISHWLQGAALVVALVGLWFLSKKQTAGQIEQAANGALPSNGQLQFGGVQIPGVDPGSIYIGGNPIYTTYNYPPAAPNPVGVTADNSGGQVQAQSSPPPPCPQNCGCGGGQKCADQQLTVSGMSGAYEGRVPSQLNNIFSLNDKGQYQYI